MSHYVLEEAALIAEELSVTKMSSLSYPGTPCRVLAKSLLKWDLQDILLCGVYARREAVSGNIDLARKVFDMALLSTKALLPMQLLRARQGFRERLRTIHSAGSCGSVNDQSVALASSAALFEELTSGWATGIEVLDLALSMVLPGNFFFFFCRGRAGERLKGKFIHERSS
ncbi:uncharacterized protein LOC130137323 [Syzygium oleosum]|uniref:uncharacterized protein LOC130137323 n=1 Tax=Syzygium oleosum TaxID=219896 RepID=UPI0024BA71CC|nr:uncharacterized protein LOC130137323 [Syzygium oleosum]